MIDIKSELESKLIAFEAATDVHIRKSVGCCGTSPTDIGRIPLRIFRRLMREQREETLERRNASYCGRLQNSVKSFWRACSRIGLHVRTRCGYTSRDATEDTVTEFEGLRGGRWMIFSTEAVSTDGGGSCTLARDCDIPECT